MVSKKESPIYESDNVQRKYILKVLQKEKMVLQLANRLSDVDPSSLSEVEHQVNGRSTRIRSIGTNIVTPREKEVLQKISEGLTVKEIAASLFVSGHTIISHKKNLVDKFGARNAVDLIVKAIRLDVVKI